MSRVHKHNQVAIDEMEKALNLVRAGIARSRQIRVGIVGAGFAGLRCADVLLRHGCDVTIFEARDRLGGRVAQSQRLGHLVDLGPNWIHGTTNNPMMDLAARTKTRTQDAIEEGAAFDVDGAPIPSEDVYELEELLWGEDGLIPAAFRHSNDHTDSIDPQTSLYDFFVEKSHSFFANEPADIAARKRRRFLRFCYMYSFYIGSPMTRQSLKFFWLEECIGGENPFVAETYHKILDAVSQAARERAHIRHNTEIVGYTSHAAEDAARSPHGGASIDTADGSTFSFDEVVITVPLGCLKQTKTAFKPELPVRLSQAIDNIGYGHLDKVYITFPSAFWDAPTPTQVPTADLNPGNDALPTPDTVTPSNDRPSPFASFVHFLQPEYAQSTNPEGWMQEAVNLAALAPDCAHPTLLFYIQGPQSQHVAALVASHADASEAERDAALLEFFLPYVARLPNYDPADPACVPTGVLATAWANDRFAGHGSYSNIPVGLTSADRDIEAMRRGMPERHLWLAGEHTAPFVALGTSTGAYLSGEGVAERIVQAYELATETET